MASTYPNRPSKPYTGPVPVRMASQALAEGYQRLTIPYSIPGELGILENACAMLESGGISYVLVKCTLGYAIWRKPHHDCKNTGKETVEHPSG